MLIADLISPVRVHLKGAPDPTVTLYLRRAAKQFCQDTKVWVAAIGSVAVSPPGIDEELTVAVPSTGNDDDFELPEQSYLNSIAEVRLDKNTLDGPFYRYSHVTGLLTVAAGTITQDGTLYVDAVLEPVQAATEIPDFIGELWGEGIADYAIAEMMLMPDQEWSNAASAGVFKSKYDSRVAEATVDKVRQGSQKRVRLAPIPFV